MTMMKYESRIVIRENIHVIHCFVTVGCGPKMFYVPAVRPREACMPFVMCSLC